MNPEDIYIYDEEPEDSDLVEEIEWEAPRAPLSYNYDEDDLDDEDEEYIYDDEY